MPASFGRYSVSVAYDYEKIFDMLSGYKKFVRVGIAYIMNLEHIDNLNAQDICLYTGKRIALPRGAYRALKEQYFRYYCG